MPKTKVLITVKTYPAISGKYDELVCTAGFTEEGKWIRIYPVPFRKKDYAQQYKKYEWIELDLVKNTSDFRPESFRPYSLESEIKILNRLDTSYNWHLRKQIVLQNVYTDLSKLISEAKNKKICTSLAVFKPTKIKDFKITEVSRVWDEKKLAKIKAQREQGKLFEHPEDPFEVVDKLPYKFVYSLEDDQGKESNMMIEDWEIGALYWNSLKRYEGNEAKAVADVKKKYFDDFAKTKDLYLFLGTSQVHHYVSHNPFMIIGTFHPKFEYQTRLF
ncbi:hypothetical protein [Leeuwenhoekiella sp. UBA6783]|uniref:hypothetical protein n=1 Tax=Leeuwenhoekiella sp. UBA6783 TaxID=1946747 RepID=UPI0025BB1CB4|nr:hypothetical protein [Leeuwenhoekiella sp. UBA6783]|tara:strand:+ start:7980 stop:8801 length:822 start_codon:yes stop_codon:yes gene_type:complete